MQMQQLDKRIRKMLEILEDYCVIRTVPVDEILCTDHGRSEWKTFRNGSFWGENGQEWVDFRFRVSVPDSFCGQTVLSVLTGREKEWEAVNPQIVVWVDGRIEQAFDTKHHDLSWRTGRNLAGHMIFFLKVMFLPAGQQRCLPVCISA